jgi:hypothetical protein
MARVRPWLLALALAPVSPAFAEDPAKPAPAPAVPGMATNEDAKAALVAFRAAFKGNDVDRKAQAVFDLAKVQHPAIVAEIGKLLSNRDLDVKTVAAMALGDVKALPALAGARLTATFEANATDGAFMRSAIDSRAALGHRASLPALVKKFKDPDPGIVKSAMSAVGEMKDVRALDALLEMAKDLKIDEGVKWEGGEVHVDTGASGDTDQKAAEAQYAKQYGNQAHAKRSSGRRMRDMKEVVLDVLKDLTGEQFRSGVAAREWVAAHQADLAAKRKALDEDQARQEADGKKALSASKGS